MAPASATVVMRTALFILAILPAAALPAVSDEQPKNAREILPTIAADPASPWYPHRDFPHLNTSDWAGNPNTRAVIVLAIDDMRDSAKYEQFLRPILNRLKQIDGRAPLSIMTNRIDPADPQLQSWLGEGLTIECHTADHPCPLLRDGDLQTSVSTYNRCIDQMAAIPGNLPVAFRTPCCDSLNTVSPRFFSEIFSGQTEQQRFLQIDSSVFMFYSSEDPRHARDRVLSENGEERFLRYLPTGNQYRGLQNDHFVNYVKNYPWPWIINNDCWEIPCLAPSDWSAQHLQGVNNPLTLEDWKAAIDLTVAADGCFSVVFHPHGWIQAEQVVELIDYAVTTHGNAVQFMNFREVAHLLNQRYCDGGNLRENPPEFLADWQQARKAAAVDIGELNEQDQALLEQILQQPADYNLPPLRLPDGSHNGFFIHDRHLCWQNEHTSGNDDLLVRVNIQELLRRVRREQARRDYPLTPVGSATVDITPDYPVRLTGYGGRSEEATTAAVRIHARALAIGPADNPQTLLLTVDNCGIPASVTERVYAQISEQINLPRERFAISATHSHSAPWLRDFAPNIFAEIPPEHAERLARYESELTQKLVEVALQSLRQMTPAKLSLGFGRADFAMNRRALTDGRWSGFGEVPDGPVDQRVPLLVAHDANDRLLALLVNYACHCTTEGGNFNQISGDWAGFAADMLEEEFPGAVALVSIGCGADANPSPRGTHEQGKAHGRTLADEVIRILQETHLQRLNPQVTCRLDHIDLPLTAIPDRAGWEQQAQQGGVTASRAAWFLKLLDEGGQIPTSVPSYPVQTWCFGDDLAMVFLAGEVVVDYALRLNEMLDGPRLWINAYSNDVPCYISSARLLREGGYETDSSMLYYRQPGRLAPETEDLICQTVQRLTPHEFYSESLREEFPEPKSPQDALNCFTVRPGVQVVLAASEPLIRDPVAFDWDHRGRLWVVEMGDYPLANGPNHGRVRILEDVDGDYRYDTAVTFLDNLQYPSGIQCWQDGVIITMAPQIFYAEDTTGDGIADVREALYQGFAEGNQQHRVNGLRWGLDGWLYLANGDSGGSIGGTGFIPGAAESRDPYAGIELRGRDLKIDPQTNRLEALAGQSQFARERDDFDNWFGNNNSNPIWHYQFEDRYLSRNPHAGISGGRAPVAAVPGAAPVFPSSRTLARFNDFAASNRFTSACSTMIFRSHRLGEDVYGNAFTSEPVHNLISRLVLTPTADESRIGFHGERAPDEQDSEFLSSSDNWFRPTMLRTGPDGGLWVADMYRAVIEHPQWIPQEFQRRMDLTAGTDKGRIWRIIPASACCGEASNSPAADIGQPAADFHNSSWRDISPESLTKYFTVQNGWWRDLAHRLLTHHAAVSPAQTIGSSATMDAAVVLLRMAADGGAGGVQALYAAQQILAEVPKVSTPQLLRPFLLHADPELRKAAVRLLEDDLASIGDADQEVLQRLIADPDYEVRRQLLLTLGQSDAEWAATLLGEAIAASADQPVLVSCGLTSLHAHNISQVLSVLANRESTPPILQLTRLLLPQAARLGASEAAAARTVEILRSITPETGNASFADLADLLRDVLQSDTTAAVLNTAEVRQLRTAAATTAMNVARDVESEPDRRLAAFEFYAVVSTAAVSPADQELLLSPITPPILQQALIRSLVAAGDTDRISTLAASFDQLSPSVRSELLEQLLRRPRVTSVLLDQIAAKRISIAELNARHRQTLVEHPDADLAKRAATLLQPEAQSDLQQLIEQQLSAVEQLQGSVADGHEVFRRHCSACHRLGDTGKEIGADLTALKDRSTGSLLTAILDPNRAAESKFLSYSVVTSSGLQLTGMLRNETGSSITLLSPDGKELVLPRTEIELLQSSGKSLMPEGLQRDLSTQHLADVIAFLQQAESPWKRFPGNEPGPVSADADGNLILTAAQAEIHGPSLVFEPQYQNLGYWCSTDDFASWTVDVPSGGHWTLEVRYACDDQTAGGLIRFSTGTRMLTSRIPGTGTWDEYRTWNAGKLDLRRGRNRITATALEAPRMALIDLHSIRLIPPTEE